MLILKNNCLWTSVCQESKELISFEIWTRNARYFENLSEKTSYVEPKKYAQTAMPLIIYRPGNETYMQSIHLCRAYESVVVPLLSTFCTKNSLPIKEFLYD